MSRPEDVALDDQLTMAMREAAQPEVQQWLQPEGIDQRVELDYANETIVGPVTLAFAGWMTDVPHRAGCMLAAASPRPLFGVITDHRLWCPSCFEDVMQAFHDTQSHFCSICKYDADLLSPTSMRLGIVTVMAWVCERCQRAEYKASISRRWVRIAGRKPTACEGEVRPSH